MRRNMTEQPHSSAKQRLSVEHVKTMLTQRSNFGVPGSSLTWGKTAMSKNDIQTNWEGECDTGRVLNKFAREHSGVKVFHSIRWPGNKGDTDHILLYGNRVLIIDSKRWIQKRKYSVTANGTVIRGTVRFAEGNVTITVAMNAWRRVLPKDCAVHGVVCISQRDVYVLHDEHWGKAAFKLITLAELPNFLERALFGKDGKIPDVPPIPDPHAAYQILLRLIKPKQKIPTQINFRDNNSKKIIQVEERNLVLKERSFPDIIS